MAAPRSKYSLLGRFKSEDIYNAFLSLEDREQTLVIFGLIVLFIIMLVLPVSCASSKLSKMEKEYKKAKQDQGVLLDKISSYQAQKATLSELKTNISKSKGGSLSTVIEGVANEAGIGQKIERLKPIKLGNNDFYDEDGVDGVLSSVTLDQVVSFFYALENSKTIPMKVKKIQIKPKYGKRDEITAVFQVSTITLKEGETSE